MIDARTIAVADIVEAMDSHRPYRASLGIDNALNELNNNSGIYYDSDVVKACPSVIEESTIEEIFSI